MNSSSDSWASYILWSIFLIGVILVLVALAWFFQSPDDLQAAGQLGLATDIVRQLLVLSLIAGVASMAVVQTLKHLLRARGRFHYYELRKQFGIQLFELLGFEGLSRVSPIIRLDISLEQLLALVGGVAEQAILQPEIYQKFLIELGGPRLEETIEVIIKANEMPEIDTDTEEVRDAYAVLRSAVEQGLDSLQITLGSRWRYYIRFVAALTAGLIGLVALVFSNVGPAGKIAVLVTAFVWGGAFSWLARDVAALIEKWRS